MWVCATHMKETLSLLETPHVSKASYQIKCSICNDFAVAKVYYTHQTYRYIKKLTIDSLTGTSQKKLG